MPRITPIPWWKFEKVVLAAGFRFAQHEGSHRTYTKEGIPLPLVIPTYDQLPVSIIRNNLRTAGISRNQYFRLLQNL